MKHSFSYEIKYSNRKSLSIEITRSGMVCVRAPKNCPASWIDDVLAKKQEWIQKHLTQIQAQQKEADTVPPLSGTDRARYRKLAKDIFSQKTAHYAKLMGVTYGKITIREQKTRWGSCSSAGNLNYNWRLIFAPEEVVDYIVVHELAHRKEMNHSKAFYAVVSSILPDYKKQQRWLKEHGNELWLLV